VTDRDIVMPVTPKYAETIPPMNTYFAFPTEDGFHLQTPEGWKAKLK